jgi:hypothetical protein
MKPIALANAVYAATHTLNGEMTGTHWLRGRKTLAHPILITNTVE